MTRQVIGFEGKPSILPGIWLAPNSLKMADERLEVFDRFNYSEPPIGWATDLQRNGDEVSVDIELFSGEEIDKELWDVSFFADHLLEDRIPATDEVPEHRLILEARVRAISLIPREAIPTSLVL